MNVKCSGGFYLEVATKALQDIAKHSCDTPLVIANMKIQCSNNRISLDNQNLLVNNTLFFNILDHADSSLGKVTVHCHATTKVVQLQGSRLISGLKAPVWCLVLQ